MNSPGERRDVNIPPRSGRSAVDATDLVTVEFYGIPRQRSGRVELAVPAGRVAEVLTAIEQSCPGLAGLSGETGRLSYLLSINGDRFVDDLQATLHPGDRLLLFSADAGG
jgi:molybdopterin converting factor small subunit